MDEIQTTVKRWCRWRPYLTTSGSKDSDMPILRSSPSCMATGTFFIFYRPCRPPLLIN